RTEEGKCLVSLAAKGAHRLAGEFISRRLRASMAGCEGDSLTDKREVEPEVMPAELQHPRRGGGRLTEERHIIFVVPEHGLAAGGPQHLVTFHDLPHFVVPLRTERRGQHRHRRLALGLGEIPYTPTRIKARRQVPVQARKNHLVSPNSRVSIGHWCGASGRPFSQDVLL